MIIKTTFLITATLFILSCKKPQEIVPEIRSNKIGFNNEDNPFKNVPTLPQKEEGIEYELDSNSDQNSYSADNCNVEVVTKTIGIDEHLLLAPGSDVIYLGSVLDAISSKTKTPKKYTPILKQVPSNSSPKLG